VHDDETWLPLVDEPIAALVRRVQEEDPEVAALVASPTRQLAFRTFAAIRVGVLLGQLLVDHDVPPGESGSWVEALAADPRHFDALAGEIRAVAREVAADPKLADEVEADAAVLERLRAFMRDSLS
jgi:hypothetical protein